MALTNWTDRAIRRLKRIKKSRQDLADYLHVHISTVNGYFRTSQRNEPSLDTIEKISTFLKVHPAWLLYNVRTKEPQDVVEDTLRTCVDVVVSTAEKMGVELKTDHAIKLAVYVYENYDDFTLTESNIESLINLTIK